MTGKGPADARVGRFARIAAFIGLAWAAGCAPEAQPPREACPDLTLAWNGELQEALAAALDDAGEMWAIRSRQLAVAVADISDPRRPRLAAFNPKQMFYGTEMPKLGILFATLVEIDRGSLSLDDATRRIIRHLARRSSNVDATWLFDRIGASRVAWNIAAEPQRLYHPDLGGGLFARRTDDASLTREQRALANLIHGANPLQAARFYHLVACGEMFSAELSEEIPDLLGMPELAVGTTPPKDEAAPETTWSFHADSGIVVRGGDRYVIAALATRPLGETWLLRIVGEVDDMMSSFETAGIRPPGPTKF